MIDSLISLMSLQVNKFRICHMVSDVEFKVIIKYFMRNQAKYTESFKYKLLIFISLIEIIKMVTLCHNA